MITFSQTGSFNAPVEKLFSIIADPALIPKWRKDVPAITQISGETQAGTTFFEEVHFMGVKQLLMKVTEFVPNKKLVIEAQTGMSLLPTQTFVFSQQGDQARVDLSVSMRVSGFFKLMQFMLPSKLKKTWAEYFDNLRNLAEK